MDIGVPPGATASLGHSGFPPCVLPAPWPPAVVDERGPRSETLPQGPAPRPPAALCADPRRFASGKYSPRSESSLAEPDSHRAECGWPVTHAARAHVAGAVPRGTLPLQRHSAHAAGVPECSGQLQPSSIQHTPARPGSACRGFPEEDFSTATVVAQAPSPPPRTPPGGFSGALAEAGLLAAEGRLGPRAQTWGEQHGVPQGHCICPLPLDPWAGDEACTGTRRERGEAAGHPTMTQAVLGAF